MLVETGQNSSSGQKVAGRITAPVEFSRPVQQAKNLGRRISRVAIFFEQTITPVFFFSLCPTTTVIHLDNKSSTER